MIINVLYECILLITNYYYKINGTLYCIVLNKYLSLLYQNKNLNNQKFRVMKNLIISIYYGALILLIPALFIGYLYNSDTTNTNQQSTTKAKTNFSGKNEITSFKSGSEETSFKPGLIFVLRGI